MARKKDYAFRDRARNQTLTHYFGGMWPPHFLVRDEEGSGEGWQERHQTVLQATWEEFRELLGVTPHQQRTGYTTLKALASSLKEWLVMVREQADHTKKYCDYYDQAYILIYNEGLEHGLDTPLGTAFPVMFGINGEIGKRGWSKNAATFYAEDAEDETVDWEQIWQKATISFRVPNAGNGIKLDDPLSEYFTFSPGETFRQALETVKRDYQIHKPSYDGLRRTQNLLRFRWSVVMNVLWQFELYGHIEPLTSEQAGQMIEEARPGRPTEIDRNELTRVIWTVLRRNKTQKKCWHQTGQAAGAPNFSGIVGAILEDDKLGKVLIKPDGEVIAFDYATKLVGKILDDLRIHTRDDLEAMTDEDFETRLQTINS